MPCPGSSVSMVRSEGGSKIRICHQVASGRISGVWLEHVAGLGGALEGVGRASPPSPSLSAAQRAASSSQISAQTPAAPRRNAELSTLPVPVTTRVMLPVPAATSDSQPKDGAGPPGALPYIYMAAAALIQIQI